MMHDADLTILYLSLHFLSYPSHVWKCVCLCAYIADVVAPEGCLMVTFGLPRTVSSILVGFDHQVLVAWRYAFNSFSAFLYMSVEVQS